MEYEVYYKFLKFDFDIMLCCFLCCMKQKVSVVMLSFFSLFLFLAGGFTVYVGVCLYGNYEILGGGSNNDANKSSSGGGGNSEGSSEIAYDSYIVIFSLLMGVSGVILAFFGCCAARTRDRCSVCFFTTTAFIFFLAFTASGTAMMLLHAKTDEVID